MTNRYQTLQVSRGLAALLVVFFHANALIQQHTGSFVTRLFLPGQSGVDFFFVLSGFIIFATHYRDFGKRNTVLEFIRRRVVRIYPLYILLTMVFLACYAMHLGHCGKLNTETVIKSLTLLPQDDNSRPVITVAWTLSHEILFYGVFALLISAGARVRYLIVGTLLALTILNCFSPLGPSYWTHTWLFSPFNLEFAMGCLAAWIAPRLDLKLLFWAGLPLLLASWMVGSFNAAVRLGQHSPQTMLLLFGIPYFFIVAGLASIEYRRQIGPPVPLIQLGDATYSIYLSHFVIVSGVLAVGFRLHVQPALEMLAAAAVSVAVGWLIFKFVENPMLIRMKTMRRGAIKKDQTSASAIVTAAAVSQPGKF